MYDERHSSGISADAYGMQGPWQQLLHGASDLLKATALFILTYSGAIRLTEFAMRHTPAVITYHRIIPRETMTANRRPPNTLYVDEFEQHMKFLSRRFNVLTGKDVCAVVAGEKLAPPGSVIVTFDDGYENNFEYAFPVLKKYSLHAVFFLTTDYIGTTGQLLWFDRLDQLLAIAPKDQVYQKLREADLQLAKATDEQMRSCLKAIPVPRLTVLLAQIESQCGDQSVRPESNVIYGMMNWQQAKDLVHAGMTVGSHTCSHQILSFVDEEIVDRELLSSRQRIEVETGKTCSLFAYPNGARRDFRITDELAVKRAGYKGAFTQIPGRIENRSRCFALPRIPVPDTGNLAVLRVHMTGIARLARLLLRRK